MHRLFFLLYLIGLLACGRTSPSSDEAKFQALLEQSHDLECARQTLRSELDSLWSRVADSLDARLPTDMEADERRNMIGIRNAGLIRMFEVYPSLDSSVHHLVDWAEEQDARLAAEIRQWQDQQQAHEAALHLFFGRLEEKNPQQYGQWRDSLNAIPQMPCAASKK